MPRSSPNRKLGLKQHVRENSANYGRKRKSESSFKFNAARSKLTAHLCSHRNTGLLSFGEEADAESTEAAEGIKRKNMARTDCEDPLVASMPLLTG